MDANVSFCVVVLCVTRLVVPCLFFHVRCSKFFPCRHLTW